jgi:DNA-binding PadR family transcriptional regulator
MSDRPRSVDHLLPLKPRVLHILLALADGPRHGYAIMQEVARLTDGGTRMGPGTLYGTIKRLLAAGLIEEADERPDPALDDERRRYYRITRLGRRVLEAEAVRMTTLLAAARAKKVFP